MEKKKNYLNISNCIEHFLFPAPMKLTSSSIYSIIPYFTLQNNISLDKYKDIMKRWCDKQLEGVWWVVKSSNNEKVDPRVLAIVLFLQLIGTKLEKKDTAWGFNQSFKQSGINYSPLSSPRSKTTRPLYFSNEQSNHLTYIKDNLKTMLKIISSDQTNDNPLITANQFNYLSILFRIEKGKSLASISGLFPKQNSKQSLNNIHDAIINRLAISQNQVLSIQSLTNVVTIKDQKCRDKDVKIIGCSQSYIYIESSINSLYVINCINTSIYIAGCSKIALIDKCQKLLVTIAAGLLRVCNTIDSTIYYYGVNSIVLSGDNRSLILGPNNSCQSNLRDVLNQCHIPVDIKYMNKFESPLCIPYSANSYQNLQVSQFNILSLPTKGKQLKSFSERISDLQKMILTPEVFKKELHKRYKYFQQLKNGIKSKSFNQEKINKLHIAIQGNFRQWLVNSGAIKTVNDLVKMLQQ